MSVVYNHWTGMVEWNSGLEWWNDKLHAVLSTHVHVTSVYYYHVATKSRCVPECVSKLSSRAIEGSSRVHPSYVR